MDNAFEDQFVHSHIPLPSSAKCLRWLIEYICKKDHSRNTNNAASLGGPGLGELHNVQT